MGRKKNDALVTGRTVTTRSGQWQTQLTFHDGRKPPSVRIWPPYKPGTSRAMADEHTSALVERAVKELAAKAVPSPSKDMLEWLDTWNGDRVASGLKSTHDNMSHYSTHIGPLTNWAHVRDWTSDTMRALSMGLKAKVAAKAAGQTGISGKTAVNIWSTATQMCDDACEHDSELIRCRGDNPAERVRGPKKSKTQETRYLWPTDVMTFLRHREPPILWRVVVAVAIYTYLRDGELRVLECGDVDLEHAIIRVNKAWVRTRKGRPGYVGTPKGGKARDVMIEATLVPLLAALKAGRPDGARLLPVFPSERDMARGLRRWLRRAGVNRSELHFKSPTTSPIRFHHMRSTGITWRAVRDDPKWELQYHAGHLKFATTEIYLSLAAVVRRGFGEVFPELPAELIEAARTVPSAANLDHVS